MSFKIVEFDCKLKMHVKIDDSMNEKEIIDRIEESFDFITGCASSDCDFSDEFSAYMTFDRVKNLNIM